MKINGLQKLTTLDYPEHLACTVFSGGCNLRCPFCHNAGLVVRSDSEEIPESELLDLLSKRRGMLDGVAFTGGEPLLQKDIGDFMRKVKDMGFDVKLDTNGCFPDALEKLINDGLVDYVAMDIKNCPEKYPETCGVKTLDIKAVERSRDIVMTSGVDYEFRTTVVGGLHTLDDIVKAAHWIKGAKRWFLQCFVDSGDLIGSGFSSPSKEELEAMKAAVLPVIPAVELRGI